MSSILRPVADGHWGGGAMGGARFFYLGLLTKVRQQVPRRGYGGQQPPVYSDVCDL
jgi:hypothetical protein